jgi:Ca2+-binding EF-hand superfamily protein
MGLSETVTLLFWFCHELSLFLLLYHDELSVKEMGCTGSIEKRIPADWFKQFIALKLTRSEIKKLFTIYRKIDSDRSGSVDIIEMLTYLDIENTSFNQRVFSVFDMNRSGRIDFREFVLSLWNYCTLGNATLDIFTFDLYDKDRSGVLSPPEVEQMVIDLYGKNYANNAKAKR